MAELTPSRSVILELREERQAMADGYAFLDEKCLLLAGEILKELARHARLRAEVDEAFGEAASRLRAALGRHGLEELSVYPVADASAAAIERRPHAVMGVKLAAASQSSPPGPAAPAALPSPEAEACRAAFAIAIERCIPLAASSGNLARLSDEYRRSIRRARALDDVLLPEADRTIGELETMLEDLEREDAIAMRLGAR